LRWLVHGEFLGLWTRLFGVRLIAFTRRASRDHLLARRIEIRGGTVGIPESVDRTCNPQLKVGRLNEK
jgi:hypothetical protein